MVHSLALVAAPEDARHRATAAAMVLCADRFASVP